MRLKDHDRSRPAALQGPTSGIVDRHNQVIGVRADPGSKLSASTFEIALTETLRESRGAWEGHIEVPLAWVHGLSRDEIRLLLGLWDPALQAKLRQDP